MNISDSSHSLWTDLSQNGWEVSPDIKIDALVVRVDDYESARYIFGQFRQVLAVWASRFKFNSVIIRYGKNRWDFLDVDISASCGCILKHSTQTCLNNASTLWSDSDMNTDVPLMYFSNKEIITPVMYRRGEKILGSNQDICIVRDHDNLHVMTSKSTVLALNELNVDGSETVGRNNADFWQGSDLAQLKQNHRLNGEAPFTMTYLATTDKPKYDLNAIWVELTATYTYFQNEFGIWFRESILQDMKPARRPDLVF